MTPEEITTACLARWQSIYNARTIDLAVAPHDAGFRLKRFWRNSPEWQAEFAGMSWHDHLIPLGPGYTTFRELIRSDLLLNLIPLLGPVRAPAAVDDLVPAAPHISA